MQKYDLYVLRYSQVTSRYLYVLIIYSDTMKRRGAIAKSRRNNLLDQSDKYVSLFASCTSTYVLVHFCIYLAM